MSGSQAVINRAKMLLMRQGNELQRKYGASGSSVGYKTRNGKLTDNVALIFYVREKKSEKQLKYAGISPIPKKIEGISTDVVVFKEGFESRPSFV